MSERLVRVHSALKAAEQAFDLAIRQEYPRGAAVAWERNDHIHRGSVVEHGYGTRLLVRNDRTTRPYWIYAADIVRAQAMVEIA